MKAKDRLKLLEEESARVWKERGGLANGELPKLPELTPKERREELRRKYDLREKVRRRVKKSRIAKTTYPKSLRDI